MRIKKSTKSLFLFSLFLLLATLSGCINADTSGDSSDRNWDGPPSCNSEDGVSLYVYNLNDNNYDCLQAELKAQNSGSVDGYDWAYKVYIDANDSTVGANMTADQITDIQNRLDQIVPTNISTFGNPPDPIRESVPEIIFFLVDIQDDEYVTSQGCPDCYVAGFFDPANNSTTYSYSNGVNMLVLDGVEPFADSDSVNDLYNTLAHELQHLIHYGADPTEETWLDEGLAEAAAEINKDATEKSLFDPSTACLTSNAYNCAVDDISTSVLPFSLITWGSSTASPVIYNYYKVALFFKYLCDQSGSQCHNILHDIIRNTQHGVNSINTALSSYESDLSGSFTPFSELLTAFEDTDNKYFNAIFAGWSVAMTSLAWDAWDTEATTELADYIYPSFENAYPYWQPNEEISDGSEATISSLQPISAYQILWSGSGHGATDFSTEHPELIKNIFITSGGEVLPNADQEDMSGQTGMQLILNVNPYYFGTSSLTAVNLDSSGNYLDLGDISVAIKKDVSSANDADTGEGLVQGRITLIGNIPFTELTLMLDDGRSFAIVKDQRELMRQFMGHRMEIRYGLTGEISRRQQPIIRVLSYRQLN